MIEMVDLTKYREAVEAQHQNWHRHVERLTRLDAALYTFKDGTKISLTQTQRNKMLDETLSDINELEQVILPKLKEALQ